MATNHKVYTVAIQDEIKDLEFTCNTYIRAEKHSLGFAVSRLSDIRGAAAQICKAIQSLEKVEALICRRIDTLKAKISARPNSKKCWREIKARPLTQEEIDLKNSPLGITLGL